MLKKIRSLYLFLPKMNASQTNFDKTKCLSFFIKSEKVLEKFIEIWKKDSSITKNEFGSNPV